MVGLNTILCAMYYDKRQKTLSRSNKGCLLLVQQIVAAEAIGINQENKPVSGFLKSNGGATTK